MLRAKLETLLQLGQVFRSKNLNNSKLLDNLNIFSAHLNDLINTLSEPFNTVLIDPNNDDTAQLISILSPLKKDLENLKRCNHYSFPFWSLTSNQKNYIEDPLPLLVGSLNKLELYLIKETLNALLTVGEEFSCQVSKIFNEYKFSSYTELQQQPNLLNETINALDIHFNKLLLDFPNNSENTQLITILKLSEKNLENLKICVDSIHKEALKFHHYSQCWPASPYNQNQKDSIKNNLLLFDGSLDFLKAELKESLITKNPSLHVIYPSHNVQ